MLGNIKAPSIEKSRLDGVKKHSNPTIRNYAQIVDQVNNHNLEVSASTMPTMKEILAVEAEIESAGLAGEERDSAYHIIWYMKEFSLGRHP